MDALPLRWQFLLNAVFVLAVMSVIQAFFIIHRNDPFSWGDLLVPTFAVAFYSTFHEEPEKRPTMSRKTKICIVFGPLLSIAFLGYEKLWLKDFAKPWSEELLVHAGFAILLSFSMWLGFKVDSEIRVKSGLPA